MKQKSDSENLEKMLLLSAKQVSFLLGCSERHIWRLECSGKLPRAVRLGRKLKRWRREELLGWINDGCPEISHWDQNYSKGD